MNLTFKKGDIFAAAVVVVTAVLLFFVLPQKPAGSVVSVFHEGELLYELDLYTDSTAYVSGDYTNTIAIENGFVYIADSDCPGKDCVHRGKISSGSIICLPNRVEIRISGAAGPDTSTN